MKNKLPLRFYQQEDVVAIAKALIGKVLFSCFNGKVAAGIITETEAYGGVEDRACHAFGGRRTPRTEVMYQNGISLQENLLWIEDHGIIFETILAGPRIGVDYAGSDAHLPPLPFFSER